ncbi:MAG TPA: 3-isopropylmalate dehydratase [Nocardioides sp.]|nr:3-isopropylmalate dehydratase [Nocardioides sp.]
MKTTYEGRVWVVGDSVDTDAMYPGYAMKMQQPEAAKHVFYELRPGWTDEVQPGDLVVAGRNFGVGSSRPVASLFQILGVAGLLAEEFNSLFQRNCINVGLPALTVAGVHELFSDGDVARMDIASGVVENTTTGASIQGAGLPDMVLEILDAGGLFPMLRRDGYVPA